MKKLPVQYYLEGILRGDRVVLARAITLVESTLEAHRLEAQELIEQCLPHSGKAKRIGITGVPGVGKSTFIENFGMHLLAERADAKLAVLAIDPSSSINKGSILGDKTRMEQLSINARAYIRPSPAGDSLGGVARKTYETIVLCEAAGFNHVLVETVGVGQSETTVHSLTDVFLLLLLPGAGDELQGIKRGIVEMADIIAINKADGALTEKATQARRDYAASLHLFPAKESSWTLRTHLCSALMKLGLAEVLQSVEAYFLHAESNGWLEENRRRQSFYRLHETLKERLLLEFYTQESNKEKLIQMEKEVATGALSPYKAVDILLEK